MPFVGVNQCLFAFMAYNYEMEEKKMKSEVIVQFGGKEINTANVEAQAKEIWKEAGNKVKDLKDVKLYVKPEESKCYYVFNGEGADNNYFEI